MAGVGTEITKLLKWWRFKEIASCKCKLYAAILDKRGVKWCRNHIPRIIALLGLSAKRRKLPFSRAVARQLIQVAIKRVDTQEKK